LIIALGGVDEFWIAGDIFQAGLRRAEEAIAGRCAIVKFQGGGDGGVINDIVGDSPFAAIKTSCMRYIFCIIIDYGIILNRAIALIKCPSQGGIGIAK